MTGQSPESSSFFEDSTLAAHEPAASAPSAPLDKLHELRLQQINAGRIIGLRLRMGALGLKFSEEDGADALAERIRLHYTERLGLRPDTNPATLFFVRIKHEQQRALGGPDYQRTAQELADLTQAAIDETFKPKD